MNMRKRPSNSENLNNDFCDFLCELAEYEKNVSRNIHKYNVYRKAASVLSTHNKRVESGAEAKKLNGIGEKIAKKIDEFIHTGKLQKLDNIKQNEDIQAITLLTKVSGIGPVKAKELVQNGIKTIKDLNKNQEKLNHHQRLGLKYFEDFERKIPRVEIAKIEKLLIKRILALDPKFTVTVCGSYRRGKEESGDIDALVTHPCIKPLERTKGTNISTLKRIVDSLCDLITDTISIGETKFMGVCRLAKGKYARRLDIRLLPSGQYHCAVLYFTGSDVFNKTIRAHALETGFTLNEYSLRPVGVTGVPGEPIPVTSEEDVFEYINYPYKKPEERNM